ncbi:Methyltransferase domain-containing protein [Auraticoccus monumenti]|uniref:Methyltransferase domain-containing protein n=2 Tax=Auraticoccus monumenti TaxID=675864 RepID=A0A1G7BWT9_9ACTN|nr:Methyltransferase domain-containing protein [Auraticoccus monumenti]
MHFEARAEDYDRARPPYPEALWRELRDRGLLEPGHRALDLGAGSGQATRGLLAAGLSVTAVEPGPRLAAVLGERCPGAEVVVCRAEELERPASSFELAVAATSVHWMELDVLLPRLHRLLVPGGRLAVWRNVFGDPDVRTPFRDRLAEIVAARPTPPRRGPDAEDVVVTTGELTRSGHFTVTGTSVWSWSTRLDTDQVRRLFSTFSDWSSQEVGAAAHAVEGLGGSVVEHYRSWLLVLDRAPVP